MANSCAICGSADAQTSVGVTPKPITVDACDICASAIAGMPDPSPHWQCLNDAIWSEEDAVKGAGFTAKRGTAVRNISLVSDNAGHIEGRVNDQRIVILTEFVKKS